MQVRVAKTAGFCFGVQRAVDLVQQQCERGIPVYTLGPIIHNETVVESFERKGVKILECPEDAPEGSIVVIRSHGVGKKIYEILNSRGVQIIDATCPYVQKIHRQVEKAGREGREVVIIGAADHPEVQGILGWCTGPAAVLSTEEEARNFTPIGDRPVCVVAQTTFHYNKFKVLVEILSQKSYDIQAMNSICNATTARQTEARQLAQQSDAMIVIGSKNSSNTQKLFEICLGECDETYYIQTFVDLDLSKFKSYYSVGITAGASTPNYMIKEVQTGMSEMSFDQLLEESLVTIHNGEVVTGTVIDVKEDEIVLNIGYKSDGIITRNEYTNNSNLDLTTVVKVGDTMEAKVLKVNDGDGQVVLTYKRLAIERGNKRLEEAFENKEVLKAKVSAVVNGGLSVEVEGARVFIPASLVSDVYERNLEKYADQEIEFVITEFNPRRRRVIGDRKQLLLARKKEMQEALFARIEPGMVMEGTVKNVTDFGAFVDLGGADGLLHISEMSWGRVDNPRKFVKVGEKLTVMIKSIQGEKIALTRRFPDKNPWINAEEKYGIGKIVTGKVARMTDFGAFINLEEGVDALLHVSQIAREHVEKPSDYLTVGQEVTAKVVDFNPDTKKISLSIRAITPRTPRVHEVREEETLAYSDETPVENVKEEAPVEDAVQEAPVEEAPAVEEVPVVTAQEAV